MNELPQLDQKAEDQKEWDEQPIRPSNFVSVMRKLPIIGRFIRHNYATFYCCPFEKIMLLHLNYSLISMSLLVYYVLSFQSKLDEAEIIYSKFKDTRYFEQLLTKLQIINIICSIWGGTIFILSIVTLCITIASMPNKSMHTAYSYAALTLFVGGFLSWCILGGCIYYYRFVNLAYRFENSEELLIDVYYVFCGFIMNISYVLVGICSVIFLLANFIWVICEGFYNILMCCIQR